MRRARRGGRAAAHRSRHRGARARPRRRPSARARALAAGRERDLRQVRDPPAAGEPLAALSPHRAGGRRPRGDRLPGDGQAAPRLGRAFDPSRPRCRRGALLHRLCPRADDDPAGDGRSRAFDRLPRRPRGTLPERDPPHDARVPRRRVDQGSGARRRGADRARAPHDGGARDLGAGDDPGLSRPPDRLGDHRREHAVRRRLPGAGLCCAAGAELPRADRSHGGRRVAGPPRGRLPGGHDLHALLLATRARPGLRPTGRDIVPGGPPEPHRGRLG